MTAARLRTKRRRSGSERAWNTSGVGAHGSRRVRSGVLHIEGVLHQERDGKIAFPRLFPGEPQLPRHKNPLPRPCDRAQRERGHSPRPAPDIEDVAADLTRLFEGHELPLWSPDLPVPDPRYTPHRRDFHYRTRNCSSVMMSFILA